MANTTPPTQTIKLGLALSGGGFRATLFHIGVLRRLAEMDLLPQVGVISTVSGGSLTGAHYLLHLKQAIETKGVLARSDYIDIVRKMESECRRGVAQNPRSRLFLNPIANLRIFCEARPPGRRMATIYQSFLFRSVTEALEKANPGEKWHRGIPLAEMKIAWRVDQDIEAHNRGLEVEQKKSRGVVENIPKLILNSSCLNSGQVFVFTATEVGDPRLGFIRMDETLLVKECKQLLEQAKRRLGPAGAMTDFREAPENGREYEQTARSAIKAPHGGLEWFLRTEVELNLQKKKPETASQTATPGESVPSWDPGQPLGDFLKKKFEWSVRMIESRFGVLRKAKISAWYLLDGKWDEMPLRGGYSKEEHQSRFWAAFSKIDKELKEKLQSPGDIPPILLQFVLCVYYLRSARAFAWDVDTGLSHLRLVDAAAASANFPPVFTPYHIHNLYDPGRVRYVSLTDGGVHDNTGIKALMEEECTDIIVSDTSGLFREADSPRGDRVSMMERIGGTLTAHVRDTQLDILHDRADVSRAVWKTGNAIPDELENYHLLSTPFFHTLSNPTDARVDEQGNPLKPEPVKPHPYARLIHGIRTDLDVFGKIEIDALIYQGYQLADRFVRRHLDPKRFPSVRPNPPDPNVQVDATPYAGKVLIASAKRVGRWSSIHSVATAVGCSLLVILLIAFMYRNDLSVAEVALVVGHGVRDLFGCMSCRLDGKAKEWWDWYWHLPQAAVRWVVHSPGPCGLIYGAFGLYVLFSDRLEQKLGRALTKRIGGNPGLQMARLRAARAGGTWRRNLAWLVWLLPIWIALLGTLFFGILMLAGIITREATSRSRIKVFDNVT